jgi:hypothetical protein
VVTTQAAAVVTLRTDQRRVHMERTSPASLRRPRGTGFRRVAGNGPSNAGPFCVQVNLKRVKSAMAPLERSGSALSH